MAVPTPAAERREASGLGLDGLGEHRQVLGLLASKPRATAQLVLGVGVVTSCLAALLADGALMSVQVLERKSCVHVGSGQRIGSRGYKV